MNRLTPAGAVPIHEADNVTAAPNPLMEPAVTVAEPLSPCVKTRFDVDVSEKSGKATVELVLIVMLLVVVRTVNGALTEKVAKAESPLGLLIAVIV
jgi:hypothetical protein